MNIRKVTLDDAGTICNIYNYYIENTPVTFENTPISEIEAKQRISDVINTDIQITLSLKIINHHPHHTVISHIVRILYFAVFQIHCPI